MNYNGRSIVVKQDDINYGRRASDTYCPIALAIKRALHNPKVSVGYLITRINGRKYRLPLMARDFISAFDEGRTVEPFRFKLR